MGFCITIDGTRVEVEAGRTVLQAALGAGIYIPALCAHPDLPPQKTVAPAPAIFHGSRLVEHDPAAEGPPGCGICIVEIEGQGKAPACATPVADGMKVTTKGPGIEAFRRQRLSLILADHPHACLTCALREGCTREPCSMNVPVRERCCPLLGRCELQAVASYVGIDPSTSRYVAAGDARITSDPLFDRDPALCIACGRCVRACAAREVNVLSWVRDSRGHRFVGLLANGRAAGGDTAPALAESGCRFCGSCVEVCPTGALADRNVRPAERGTALVPCRAACPAGTDVPRYVRLVAEGNLREAAAVVAERAPLVEVLGHVCFHPCEAACRRNQVNDAPISICALKREAGAASKASWTAALPQPLPSTGKKVAVIGGGPAGLMAAQTLHQLGHAVALFEAGPTLGGMLVQGIPPFRLPREVVARETRALVASGIAVYTNTSVGHAGLPIDSLLDIYDALVVATGAALSARLHVDGEDRREVRPGLSVLEDVCTGRANANAYEGQRVAVIGGGNVAIDCARAALRLGARDVDVVCLEQPDQMPAFAHEVTAARHEGVQFHHGWGVEQFAGNGRLERVQLKKCVRVFDEDGRFDPAYDRKVSIALPVHAAIVAIGQRAEKAILPRALDRIFLAGDFATGPRSVVEAIASGRHAALAADRFLGGAGVLDLVLTEARGSCVLGRREGFASLPRVQAPAAVAAEGRLALDDVPAGLGAEAARVEADRCLRCDLRLDYRQPVWPPRAQPRHRLDAQSVDCVPDAEGVLRFFDESGNVLAIVGGANMREELRTRIGARAAAFEFEACAMYTQRQNELLSEFVETHGRMPPGVGDDEDELF